MTAKQLHQYAALCREIDALEKRIAKEQSRNEMVSDVVSGSDGQYPYIKRKFTIAGKDTGREEKLKKLKEMCYQHREEILSYIAEIEDSTLRQVFMYRHLDGLSWRAVSFRMGGVNTEDNLRVMHDRYIKRMNKK